MSEVIVALDLPSGSEAIRLLDRLAGTVFPYFRP